MEECPICTEELTGTLATLGCCQKVMHVECLVKCMKINLNCPMCRTTHESLRMVQDVESNNMLIMVQNRNQHFFRNMFMCTFVATILILSFEKYY
jgi:hypothetical protein